MRELKEVLEDQFSFDVEDWPIPDARTPPDWSTNKLHEKLVNLRAERRDRNGIFLVYYGGYGGFDTRPGGGSIWTS